MASYENNDMGSVEMDLEVFEIDGALLRELLEEQDGKDDNSGSLECMVESVEGGKDDPNMMGREQEQQQQQNCLEQYECHSSIHDFEWLNMMDMMEPTNPQNDVIMNWFSDDIVGMVDVGYANNGECYSQICDGLVSDEANYGNLWED